MSAPMSICFVMATISALCRWLHGCRHYHRRLGTRPLPWQPVAAEIHRVLKTGGLLYSELPFMQQVHEGAYDFTRYTLSGHRRLFNGFTEIETGMVAGPATALVWAIENLALAFVRRSVFRTLTKAGIRLVFSWLKWLDYLLVNRPEAMDGASCTYFLGSKITGKVADLDIINRYVGAKHLRHS